MKEYKVLLPLVALIIAMFFLVEKFTINNPIQPARNLSYESSEELKPYIDKFFRDLNNYGINKSIPQDFILKFSDLESHKTTSHFHGVSFGYNDDDKVEIYINKKSWSSFNKTQRYYIIYHELSHDILNLDDLSDNETNYGKIMYPSISKYDNLNMNDFIKNMKDLFKSLQEFE